MIFKNLFISASSSSCITDYVEAGKIRINFPDYSLVLEIDFTKMYSIIKKKLKRDIQLGIVQYL